MSETISVIVPAYNLAPWLGRCLDSILAQSYKNIEVIVVDDGSQDATCSVMEAYAAKDSRIKAIHQENGGVTAARLRGIGAATGDWIGFVDGDDEIEPQMYARLLENAHTYGADISHCGYRRDFPDGKVEYHAASGEICFQDRITALQELLEERRMEPGLCSKLFRRVLFQGLEEKMDLAIKNNEDMLMNYYLFSAAESSVYEAVCPYHYIMRSDSASHRKLNEHRIYDPIRVREIILEQCDAELKDDARQALLRVVLYVYALLTVEKGMDTREYRIHVRNKLLQHKVYFSVLGTRNQVLARMIQYAPGLFRLVFSAYVTLFLHGHYE